MGPHRATQIILEGLANAFCLNRDEFTRLLGSLSSIIEGSANKLAHDKVKLINTVGVLKETVELKTHFLDIEYAAPV